MKHLIRFRRGPKERFWTIRTEEGTAHDIMWAMQKIRDMMVITQTFEIEIKITERN